MIQLYNEDYETALSRVPDKSIDLLCTDPPYLHVKGGCKCVWLNKGVKDPNSKIVSEMSDFGEKQIYNFLNAVKPKMKQFNGYVFCSKLQVPYYLNWALENKIQFDILTWDKCTTGIHSYKFYSTKYEYIIRLYKRGLYKIEDTSLYQKVQRVQPVKNKLHEAQKPVDLIKNLLLVSTVEGDTVLDCFAGSCTTLVACKELNRNCIGFEKDLECYTKGLRRLEEGE